MIITWTTTLRKFGVCILWLDCKQLTQKLRAERGSGCWADDSHEMSSLMKNEKNKKISFRMFSATNLVSALRVNT